MALVRLSESAGIIGAVIKCRTGSWATHVEVVMPDGKLLAALPEGVILRDPPKDDVKYEVWEIPQELDLVRAYNEVGKPYDWLAIIAIGIGIRLNNPYSHNQWWCGELMTYVIKGGLSLGDDLVILPRDWLAFCQKYGRLVEN